MMHLRIAPSYSAISLFKIESTARNLAEQTIGMFPHKLGHLIGSQLSFSFPVADQFQRHTSFDTFIRVGIVRLNTHGLNVRFPQMLQLRRCHSGNKYARTLAEPMDIP